MDVPALPDQHLFSPESKTILADMLFPYSLIEKSLLIFLFLNLIQCRLHRFFERGFFFGIVDFELKYNPVIFLV